MAIDRVRRIREIVACPHCHCKTAWLSSSLECHECRREFPIRNGIPDFLGREAEKTADSEFQSEQMFAATFTGRLYNAGKKILSSEYMPKDHVREFIRRAPEGAVVVEFGSGNRRLRDDVINVDLYPFPNVDLTADIAKAPFGDESVDHVVLDTVLEHVAEPAMVVSELHRILKPGGRAVCITPFIFPYHGYPKHYANFTKDGLEFLFKGFSECKVEMNMGPLSGLVNILSEYFAVICSGDSKLLYTCFKGIGLLPIFYLKYLDKLWRNPAGRVVRIASHLCAEVVK